MHFRLFPLLRLKNFWVHATGYMLANVLYIQETVIVCGY